MGKQKSLIHFKIHKNNQVFDTRKCEANKIFLRIGSIVNVNKRLISKSFPEIALQVLSYPQKHQNFNNKQ